VKERFPEMKIIPGLYLVMRERTYMYKSLSELYKGEPHRPLVEAITGKRFRDLGEMIGEEFGLIKRGHRLICDFLEEFKSPKETMSVLHREYKKIFRGSGFVLQRNYESIENKEILNSLSRFYEKENWVIPKGHPKELDHISVECEFVVHLCAKNRKAIIDRKPKVVYENLTVQRDFLHKHVYNWFPEFCDELSKRTESKFYEGVAELTRGFIAIDKEVLTIFMEMIP